MSLWGNLDAANNAPKQGDTAGYGGNTPQVTANTQVYFGNTRNGAFCRDHLGGDRPVKPCHRRRCAFGGHRFWLAEHRLELCLGDHPLDREADFRGRLHRSGKSALQSSTKTSAGKLTMLAQFSSIPIKMISGEIHASFMRIDFISIAKDIAASLKQF